MKFWFLFALVFTFAAANAKAQQTSDSFQACISSQPANLSYPEAAARCNVSQPAQVPAPTYVAPVVTMPVTEPFGYYPTSYGNYYGGFYPGYFFDRCLMGFPKESRPVDCLVGEVKFDTSGDVNKAEVFIDGISLGEIGKYSHRATSGLRLDANTEYLMEVVWTTNSGTKTMIRRIKPSNMRLQDGAYWYPVSPQLFDDAPYGRTVEKSKIVREPVSGRDLIMKKP